MTATGRLAAILAADVVGYFWQIVEESRTVARLRRLRIYLGRRGGDAGTTDETPAWRMIRCEC
jgi:hypothetical protein